MENENPGESRYRSLFRNMLDGCAYCQAVYGEDGRMADWRYLEVNDSFVGMTGLRPSPGALVSGLIPGIRESDPGLFEVYGRVAAGGPPERFEIEVASLSMWFSVSAYCPEPGYFIASFEVINERKRTEVALKESEEKLRRLFEIAPVGISILDKDRKFIATNPALSRILRLPPDDLSAAAAARSYVDAEGRPMAPEALPSYVAAAERRAVENAEIGVDLGSGERVWVSVSAVPAAISDWDIVLTVTDVSEQKRAEERLAASLAEKAVLFNELQHRVKNNLELVSSVLSIGLQEAGDCAGREALADARSRVDAMGAIYETLVYSGGADRIELDVYIERFLGTLHETYVIDRDRVSFDARLESWEIDVKRAVSLGLILNELVTNALKYAYPPGVGGRIGIELLCDGPSITLRVGDEGRGLPPGLDAAKATSTGFTLVRLLAGQLGGSLAIESRPGGGTRAALTFPA
jgi:PAS domain S-box-containing protein